MKQLCPECKKNHKTKRGAEHCLSRSQFELGTLVIAARFAPNNEKLIPELEKERNRIRVMNVYYDGLK